MEHILICLGREEGVVAVVVSKVTLEGDNDLSETISRLKT